MAVAHAVKGLVGNLESKDSTSLVCFCMDVLEWH
jgi:hypothetical protein